MNETGDLEGCAHFADAAVRLSGALQAPGAASARLLRMIDMQADTVPAATEGTACSDVVLRHNSSSTQSVAHSCTLSGAWYFGSTHRTPTCMRVCHVWLYNRPAELQTEALDPRYLWR